MTAATPQPEDPAGAAQGADGGAGAPRGASGPTDAPLGALSTAAALRSGEIDPVTLAEAARTLLPVVTVDADRARALMQGKTVAAGDWHTDPDADDTGSREVAVVCDDALVSVAEVRRNGGLKSLTAFAIDLA